MITMEEFRQAILSLSRYTKQHPIQSVNDNSSSTPTTSSTTTNLPSASSAPTTTPDDSNLFLQPSESQSQPQPQLQSPSSPTPMESSPQYGFHEHSLELLDLDSTPVDNFTRQRVYHAINTLSTNEDMLRSLFNGIDFNGTGYIDYSEFLAACLARKEGLKREYAELIFEL